MSSSNDARIRFKFNKSSGDEIDLFDFGWSRDSSITGITFSENDGISDISKVWVSFMTNTLGVFIDKHIESGKIDEFLDGMEDRIANTLGKVIDRRRNTDRSNIFELLKLRVLGTVIKTMSRGGSDI